MPDDRGIPGATPEPVEDEQTGRVSTKFARRVAPGGAFDNGDAAEVTRPDRPGGRGDVERARTDPAPDYVTPELTPMPTPPPGGAGVAAAQFLDEVAYRLARRVPTPIPERKYLGLTQADWIKLLVGWIVAGVLFLVAWYGTVNRELDKRATREDVDRVIQGELLRHGKGIHAPAAKRLDSLESEQRTIRESQIRQEQIDTVQSETLREIRDDVRRIRKGR